MTYSSTIDLDQISEAQSGKAATANQIFAALSPAALWGIKPSVTSGLTFGLFGGNMNIAGTPTAVASQTVTLSANATNYIYATAAGVVTKTTSAPTGWPGPITSPAGAIALYTLITNGSGITSGTNHTVGMGATGATGATGAAGSAGSDFAETRKRVWMAIGNGNTTATILGFSAFSITTATARSLATSSLRESIPYLASVSAAGAGNSAQLYHATNLWYLGNAAGRGGFTVSMRFCLESASSPSTARCFFGLMPQAAIGNVEPDTLTNIIGVGANAGESSFSLLHNDSSGTATKVLLESAESPAESPSILFPARATDNVYELTLTSVANSGTVSYELVNLNTGDVASGVINSNLPSNTTYLAPVAWVNNGSAGGVVTLGMMQIVGESRY